MAAGFPPFDSSDFMRRIDFRFAELRANGRKALIPFITAGDRR